MARDIGRIVILGAGPCGLGAAWRLQELGYRDFAIHERDDRVGGLAASIRDDHGFTWDFGVHVLYSRSAYFNRVVESVLGGAWTEQRRNAQVWMRGQFVPYPLQYNVHRLPADIRRDCILGLVRAATKPNDLSSFHAWIVSSFGDGIADHFMVPYNEKVWAAPLQSMSVSWIAERVPRPDLERVLANLLDGRDDDGWGPNASFRYPREGGTGAIWRGVADRIGRDRLTLGRSAVRIDPRRRRVYFNDGSEDRYDVLVSTVPLDQLVVMIGVEVVNGAAAALRASTVHVVGIGIEGELPSHLADRRWIYFPERTVPFYRATVLSNFANTMAPPGHWSLLAEVSESPHRPIDRTHLVDAVIASLAREGFLSPDSRIVSRWHATLAHGYPTPTRDRDGALAELLPALEAMSIFSRGRFGAWRYEISNQDHSFLQGSELIGRLILGAEETTFAT